MSDDLHVYIAGPMESVGGNWNEPLFDYVAQRLRLAGCEVCSPIEMARKKFGSLANVKKLDKVDARRARREGLREDLMWICDQAQVIFLLPGWEQSPGAKAERAVALALGIRVHEANNIIVPPDDGVVRTVEPLDLPAE